MPSFAKKTPSISFNFYQVKKSMCRGELSTVIAQCLSVCKAGGSGSEELKK